MKKVYLLPPSESKKLGGVTTGMVLSFGLPLPKFGRLGSKHLKVTWPRLAQAKAHNGLVSTPGVPVLPAIERYTGVLYTALSYQTLPEEKRTVFDDSVLIVSGMYGLVRPRDMIAPYKLPMDITAVKNHRKKHLTEVLLGLGSDIVIVDLLPELHRSVIDRETLQKAGVHVERKEFPEFAGHFAKKEKGLRLRQEFLL